MVYFQSTTLGNVGFAVAPGTSRDLGRPALEHHGWFQTIITGMGTESTAGAAGPCVNKDAAPWWIGTDGKVRPQNCP